MNKILHLQFDTKHILLYSLSTYFTHINDIVIVNKGNYLRGRRGGKIKIRYLKPFVSDPPRICYNRELKMNLHCVASL